MRVSPGLTSPRGLSSWVCRILSTDRESVGTRSAAETPCTAPRAGAFVGQTCTCHRRAIIRKVLAPALLAPDASAGHGHLHGWESTSRAEIFGGERGAALNHVEPVCSMSSSNCCFLTAYRFLKRQIRWSGIPISFRIVHSLL